MTISREGTGGEASLSEVRCSKMSEDLHEELECKLKRRWWFMDLQQSLALLFHLGNLYCQEHPEEEDESHFHQSKHVNAPPRTSKSKLDEF